jgi:hypothetical protein
MRHLRISLALAVLGLGLQSTLLAAGPCGAITKVEGDAQLVRNGQTLPAAVGTPVEQGDTLRAPKGSRVDFSVNGVAGLSAAEGTECQVTRAGAEEMKIDLAIGELRANIKKLPSNASFSVETPTAIAAVRGTQFTSRVTMNEQNLPDSSFIVRDSRVDVTVKSSGEKIALNEGLALDVPSVPAGAPEARQATGAELVKMEGTSLITACA